MATPRKANPRRDLQRLTAITSRELEAIEKKQRKGQLTQEDISSLKKLSDSLSDQITINRQLAADSHKLAKDTPSEVLQVIADQERRISELATENTRLKAKQKVLQRPEATFQQPESTPQQPLPRPDVALENPK